MRFIGLFPQKSAVISGSFAENAANQGILFIFATPYRSHVLVTVYDSMVSVYDSTHIPMYMGPLCMTLMVTASGFLVSVCDCTHIHMFIELLCMTLGSLCMTLRTFPYTWDRCV